MTGPTGRRFAFVGEILMRIFIAQSLDGFIAGPDDSLDHLDPYHDVETGYDAMVRNAGAVVLGRRTFDRIFPTYGWTYPAGIRGCVLTRRALPQETPDDVTAMHDVEAVARHFPQAFIDGGAETIAQFLAAGHIRIAEIFTIPVRLGAGVKLFPHSTPIHQTWSLIEARALPKGMVYARYELPKMA
jgi:dihydrofolate reductase